jgi:hypothetical protein
MVSTGRVAGYVSSVLLIAACGAVERSVVPSVSSTGEAVAVTSTADQQSATGRWEIFIPANGFRIRMSGAAIRHPDGSVTGEFEQHVEVAASGAFVRKAHLTAVCVTIVGHTARFGAVIDRTEGVSAPPGAEVYGTLVDNGEGADDPPDLASPTIPGSALLHCATGASPPPPLFPSEHGNINVRS